MFNDLKYNLKNRLKEELPAHLAHKKVMGHRKSIQDLNSIVPKAKQSAVLILIYPIISKLHIVYIERPIYEGVHSAQIAFPGGKSEDSDESIEQTALREAEEELNISASTVEVLGKLTPLYVPPSNFIIHPFIGFQEKRPHFIPQVSEVASYIECPVESLIGEEKLISERIDVGDSNMLVRGFKVKNHLVWGATAMITKEFTEIMESL